MNKKWEDFINQQMSLDYMKDLIAFVSERRKVAQVLPSKENLFLPFKLTEWEHLKVVIVGQDPYPSIKDAHGLAFSSLSNDTPYSLQNIFNEIYNDVYEGNSGGVKVFRTNNLTSWATQGVLLLNYCFTTEVNAPGAHNDKGWETFTRNLIKFINDHPSKLVFMLWGKHAKELKKHIDPEKHLILESEHPAAMRNNPQAFSGNRHFSKCNNFIKKNYFNQKAPIAWHLIP